METMTQVNLKHSITLADLVHPLPTQWSAATVLTDILWLDLNVFQCEIKTKRLKKEARVILRSNAALQSGQKELGPL